MANAPTPERQIARYTLLERIGEGGMGVVWKGRDQRLNRLAAIKLLHADRVADEGRKRRFVQEAQAASALNHPNIVTIYDIDSEGGFDYIAMEYVQGRTLDQLIPRGGMRLGDVLKIAAQIADALAAAHAAGIVHRDLKPGNIIVTDAGLVKLVDFGLAKLTEKAMSGDTEATRTVAQSQEGTIVGTAAYMSPEQAEGRKIDHRSDIFSFGLVLYEMLTGQRAFQGETNMSTLAAIIREEARPVSQILPTVPRDMERIVARCLRKDPARRFQHADDLKIALLELKEESDSGQLAPPLATAGRPPRKWLWPIAGVAVLALGATSWLVTRPSTAPAPGGRVVPLTSMPGIELSPSFSPDGSQVAFTWNGEKQDNMDIYVRLVDGGDTLRLTTSPAYESRPSWSPDGRWIAFYRGSEVNIISPLGGQERKVAQVRMTQGPERGPSWTADSQFLLVPAVDGIRKISISSAESRVLAERNAAGVAVSPDGNQVAFIDAPARRSYDIFVMRLDGSGLRRLTSDYLPISGLAWHPNGREIVFASDREGGGLWRISTRGSAKPERIAGAEASAQAPATVRKPDGSIRLAFVAGLLDNNVWMRDLVRGGNGDSSLENPRRISGSSRIDYAAEFSPDGSRLVFSSDRTGNFELWVANRDGGDQRQLTFFRGGDVNNARWSPDGLRLAFGAVVNGNRDIYVVDAIGPSTPKRMTVEPSDDGRPRYSRDGKWLYLRSDRSGRHEIWKMPAAGGSAVQVTNGGGIDSAESVDGKMLIYENQGALWAMPAAGGEPVRIVVTRSAWGVGPGGVYFLRRSEALLYDLAARREVPLGKVDGRVVPFTAVSVSPDGKTLAWSQVDRDEADLMMIENFR